MKSPSHVALAGAKLDNASALLGSINIQTERYQVVNRHDAIHTT
jgi:hypothetical protein